MVFRKHDDTSGDHQLRRDLDEALELYAKFKLDGKPASHDQLGLHEETVIARAAIHDMVVSIGAETTFDKARLRTIDVEWQEWIQANKEPGFTLVGIEREKEPKTEWWFWIDQLDQLTPEQKQAL